MALLKRELYRQGEAREITHADRCIFVFDTDKKSLYVEREVTHLEGEDWRRRRVSDDDTMDISDYLSRVGKPLAIENCGAC